MRQNETADETPETEATPIIFVGYLPDLKTAFQADGDEIRIMIAIPQVFREQGMRLAGMFGKQLGVMKKEH